MGKLLINPVTPCKSYKSWVQGERDWLRYNRIKTGISKTLIGGIFYNNISPMEKQIGDLLDLDFIFDLSEEELRIYAHMCYLSSDAIKHLEQEEDCDIVESVAFPLGNLVPGTQKKNLVMNALHKRSEVYSYSSLFIPILPLSSLNL